jgi:hypothetical protein
MKYLLILITALLGLLVVSHISRGLYWYPLGFIWVTSICMSWVVIRLDKSKF